ncbi:MAG TPA: hypothetical protein VJ252_03230 [Chthoniobacterales bacterium]|nr:hypothetical protein [Chthoniobacterales bacterium]
MAIGLGETAFTAFGIFSDAPVSFALAPLVLAVPFFFGVASFFAVDFFLVDLDLAVGPDDFFGFAFGVVFALAVSPGFAFLDEEVVLFFGFFAFDEAVGDASASLVLRNCSRLRSSSSFP